MSKPNDADRPGRKRKKKRLRKRLRPWRHRLVYGLLLAAREWLNIYPLDVALELGGALGRAAYHLLGGMRRTALENLRLAYGAEQSPAERRRIVKAMFEHFGRMLAELATLHRWPPGELARRVDCDDPGWFERLRRGKGLTIVNGHIGNWELMCAYAAQVLRQPSVIVVRDMHNPYVEEALRGVREGSGIRVLKRGKTGREFFRQLKQNVALGIMLDQDTRRGPGIFVDFFGRPAYTQLGVYQLARRAGCTVAIGYTHRQPGGPRHRLVLGEAVVLPDGDNEEENARAFTQELVRRLEQGIRRHPEQWPWFHQRWKRRPLEDAALAGAKAAAGRWQKGDPYTQ